MKLISWNLLRLVGASLSEVVSLIEREQPDIMLMQEATHDIDPLPDRVGRGVCTGAAAGPGARVGGLDAKRLAGAPPGDAVAVGLDGAPGRADHRSRAIHNCQRAFVARANPQPPATPAALPPGCRTHAAVVGDYNLVGPVLLPGFRDAGPRRPTHRMSDVLPLRLDRCVVRGLHCEDAAVLPRGASDHRPITVRLSVIDGSEVGKHQPHRRVA